MPLKKVLGPDIPENPMIVDFLFSWRFFWFLAALVADKSFRNQKQTTKKQKQPPQKNNNAYEQSPWPRNSWQSLVFVGCFSAFLSVFLEVSCFLAVLVADKSFRSPKPKEPDKCRKQQTIMPLKKVLGPNIPENVFPFFLFCGVVKISNFKQNGFPEKTDQEERKACKTGGRTALFSGDK